MKEGREPVDLRFCETESWKKVLGVKTEAGFNEFIITLAEYPYMTMYVNNNYASLSYYWKENDPGYLSIGEENGLNDTEDMEFCMNSEYEKFLLIFLTAKGEYITKPSPSIPISIISFMIISPL